MKVYIITFKSKFGGSWPSLAFSKFYEHQVDAEDALRRLPKEEVPNLGTLSVTEFTDTTDVKEPAVVAKVGNVVPIDTFHRAKDYPALKHGRE
jgi:hypothetical protein